MKSKKLCREKPTHKHTPFDKVIGLFYQRDPHVTFEDCVVAAQTIRDVCRLCWIAAHRWQQTIVVRLIETRFGGQVRPFKAFCRHFDPFFYCLRFG